MPTVNFSVPEDVKLAFNTTFDGQNKSAIIAGLMRDAVERAQSQQRAQLAVRNILRSRGQTPPATVAQFRAARAAGRS